MKTKKVAFLVALAAQISAGLARADIVNESGSVYVYEQAYAYNSYNTVGPVTQSLPSGSGSFVGGPVYNSVYYNDTSEPGSFTYSGNSGATAGGNLSNGGTAVSGSAGALAVSSGYQLGGSGAVSPSAASSEATVSGSYYNSTALYWYLSTKGQGTIVNDGNGSGYVDIYGTIVGPNQTATGELAAGGFWIGDVVNASTDTPVNPVTGANTASTGQYDLSFTLSLSSTPISTGAAAPAYITLPTLSPVPLPSNAWLLIGGLGGLGALASRKRASV